VSLTLCAFPVFEQLELQDSPTNNDRSLSNTAFLLQVYGAQNLTAKLRSGISLATERYIKRMKQAYDLNAITTFFFFLVG
jgi:hypothetical protein